MRRFLYRLILVPLALLLIFEEWLWDELAPLVSTVVALFPFQKFKEWLARRIEKLSPWASLFVFLVPAIPLFPLKLLGLWLLGKGHWLLSIAVLVFAKVVGMGVTAFLFRLTKAKLLQLEWFVVFYESVLWLLEGAHRLADPVKKEIRAVLHRLRARSQNRTWRLLRRIQRKHANVNASLSSSSYDVEMTPLVPFSPEVAISEVSIQASCKVEGSFLCFQFQLQDPKGKLERSLGTSKSWNEKELKRAHELWKSTCFEAFWGVPGTKSYWEFNLSSEGRYNIYRFEDYRLPQPPQESFEYEIVDVKTNANSIEWRVRGDVQLLEVSLCAILKTPAQTGYYSAKHAGAKPDFHLRNSFCLRPTSA